MNGPEETKALRHEVQLLHEKLRTQYHQLQSLQQRLSALDGGPSTLVTDTRPKKEKKTLENFIGLRLMHLVGIVVLVIGLSIGVKYAIDQELISESTRIGLAYFAAIALYVLSWKLKRSYTSFSAILFSGAAASAYFTTYAAFGYYALLPFSVAFAMMIAITVFAVIHGLQPTGDCSSWFAGCLCHSIFDQH